MSPPHIEQLLLGEKDSKGGRYSAQILPLLEDHLNDQLEDNFYDSDANLAILKLYLLHPKTSKSEVIEGILAKALMAFPNTDFSLCYYQIPKQYHKEMSPVSELAKLLEMAQFKSFWEKANTTKILAKTVGWEDAVRSYIAGVVAQAFRTISEDQLLELFNVDEAELDAIITQRGWSRSRDDASLVVVNTATFESIREEQHGPTNITLEHYKKLVQAAAGM